MQQQCWIKVYLRGTKRLLCLFRESVTFLFSVYGKMMNPHDYTWIFAVTMVLAFADAYGIGANDVANAFATSVSSGSLTLVQAAIIACFTEFLGAVLLGNMTSETIKSGIVPVDSFVERPELLMTGMLCALFGSATWVIFASRQGWPVSTTHSIVGAIIGMGFASFGPNTVDWSWNGVGGIIASWFISPVVSGAFTAIIYLIVKYGVLERKNSVKYGLWAAPIFFFITITIEVFYIMYKGAPRAAAAKTLTIGAIVGIAIGIGAFFGILGIIFVRPWLKRKVVDREDIKWYHVFVIPVLPKRPTVKDPETIQQEVSANVDESHQQEATEKTVEEDSKKLDESSLSIHASTESQAQGETEAPLSIKDRILNIVLHGLRQDVRNINASHLEDIHAAAVKYDNDTEYMFSFLQILTAMVFSFAHGSNDVANAVGPLSAVFSIWNTGAVDPDQKIPVEIWILVYGGIAIDIGLVTLGYRVMRRMGNNITYMTPTRGFSTELGAAITILTCSQLGIPVSSTHCATGSTAAVGLCNGNLKSVNWKMLAWCMFAWIFTLPIAGLISGLTYAIVTRSPSFY